MRNKTHGLEEGDVLTYNDYLDKTRGEQSPDTAPTLIPVLENGNVTMKSFSSELERSAKVLEEAQDFSNCLGVIEVEHYFIHSGRHYFHNRLRTIGANATINILVETEEHCHAHFLFSLLATEGAISYVTYENIEANEDGTLLNIRNNFLGNERETGITLRLNPTGITGNTEANVIRDGRVGKAGNPSQRASGNTERGDEIIFESGKKYLLTITNLINETNYVNVNFSWYENGQC